MLRSGRTAARLQCTVALCICTAYQKVVDKYLSSKRAGKKEQDNDRHTISIAPSPFVKHQTKGSIFNIPSSGGKNF